MSEQPAPVQKSGIDFEYVLAWTITLAFWAGVIIALVFVVLAFWDFTQHDPALRFICLPVIGLPVTAFSLKWADGVIEQRGAQS